MSHLSLRTPDDDLLPVLRNASSEDLGILVEYIMKDWNQDLMTVPDFKRLNPKADKKIYDGDHRVYADDIAAEIQRYGGNTFANAFRGGKGVEYIETLRDVASSLKVTYHQNSTAATIESQIQFKILEDAYAKMSVEERAEVLKELGVSIANGIPSALPVMAVQATIRLTGFASYKLALVIANAIAKFILGKGLAVATNATITRTMAAFAGPIGWAITAIWTLVDIAGPANRVLIPCVLQVAYMRQKALVVSCPKCGEPRQTDAKFCQNCGAPAAKVAEATPA